MSTATLNKQTLGSRAHFAKRENSGPDERLKEHKYEPRGICKNIFTDQSPELVVAGPAGTGKSRACLEKVHAAMLLNPNAKALVVRKTATSLTSTALATYKNDVAAEAIANGTVVWYGGSAQEPSQYIYRNGASIVIAGLDKPSKIMSSEYDLIYVQEATELDETDWELLSTRLRNGRMWYQQLLADCNPDTPTHWLKKRAEAGRTKMINSSHKDNPRLYKFDPEAEGDGYVLTDFGKQYMQKLEALTGVRKLRLLNGLWVAAEGVIYDEFDPAVHLIDAFEIPESWTRYWTIDFGFTNPMVVQAWAEDDDDNLYMYREFYRTGTLVEDVASILSEWAGEDLDNVRPAAIICDHDAEGRATLEKHLSTDDWSVSTVPANKKVLEGIQAVQARLRARKLFIMRGVQVSRDPDLDEANKPTHTAEEIPGYVWQKDGQGSRAGKEQPTKENDHGCDAMRYMVAYKDVVRQYAVGRGMRKPGSTR